MHSWDSSIHQSLGWPQQIMDRHYEGSCEAVWVVFWCSWHPVTLPAGEPEWGAGLVEITVPVVSVPRAPVVAVEMTVLLVVALHLALLQTGHLSDEVDGEILTLTVYRLTPGAAAARGCCRGASAQTQQYREEKCWRQHSVLSWLARLSRATEACLSKFSL